MSRPLRLEFPGAVYHVTSRGDRRELIYRGEEDRRLQLEVLAQAMERFDAQVLAYCQMGNHYHLVLHTRQANLSRLMRHLNGVYTQRFNQRHGLVGHLFQGRFKAILVDREAYLLTLCRYVERNPVAAGMIEAPQAWPWSSCQAHLGLVPTPTWLDTEGLHGYLLARPVLGPRDSRLAIARYAELLGQQVDAGFWEAGLRRQVFLGDDSFVESALAALPARQREAVEVPRVQRHRPLSLGQLMQDGLPREAALHAAYTEGGLTMTQLARELGLSVSRVSRLIAGFELGRVKGKT
jgi:REP element-mobilizing transposase RayT